MTDEAKRAGFVSPSKNGRIHDKHWLDKIDIVSHIPHEVTFWGIQDFKVLINSILMPRSQKKRDLEEAFIS